MIATPHITQTNQLQTGLVLRVDITTKSYGKTPILGPIAFDLSAGDTIAITGPSGSGKSTLLRLIAGLDRDYHGKITAPDRIGFVFQEPVLLPWLSAIENLTVCCNIPQTAAQQSLQSVGLGQHAHHYPSQLSLGQQRRLALARAFAITPDLLLLDEAFVSLDPQLADEMMTLFENLRRATPVATLIVTHDRSEAARLATRTLTLRGRPATLT